MGQILNSDSTLTLLKQPEPQNCHPTYHYTSLNLYPLIQTPFSELTFWHENYFKIEAIYKFFPKIFVHLHLTKEKSKNALPVHLKLANQHVYGYKYKKNEKIQRIRPDKIFFIKRLNYDSKNEKSQKISYKEKLKNTLKNRSKQKIDISVDKNRKNFQEDKKVENERKKQLVRMFAQVKLFSGLNIGGKVGRMVDGCDGLITQEYIEYYSQIVVESPTFSLKQLHQRQKVIESLSQKHFKILNPDKIDITYSVFQRYYLVKHLKSENINHSENSDTEIYSRAINFLVKTFEEEINITIAKLDRQTNQISAINNHLNHRDVEKAMSKFQDTLQLLDQNKKIQYAEEMINTLAKHGYYKQYEKDILIFIESNRKKHPNQTKINQNFKRKKSTEFNQSTDHRFLQLSQQIDGNIHQNNISSEFDCKIPTSPPSKIPKSRLNNERLLANSPMRKSKQKIKSKEISPIRSKQTNYSQETHEKSSSNEYILGFNNSPSNKNQFVIDFNVEALKTKNKQEILTDLEAKLRIYILDNKKLEIKQTFGEIKKLKIYNELEGEIQFAKILMANSRSRHALMILERLVYRNQHQTTIQNYMCSFAHSLMGIIEVNKEKFNLAISHFEKALDFQLRRHDYSRRSLVLFSNLGCVYFLMNQLEKSMLYLHRGLKLGQYCADYELLLRSNMAMCLAEKGLIKQAKIEMYKTYKNIEPNSNMNILCKFYSNLGYLDLLDNALEKAKTNFEFACLIEDKCLLTNGYRPSLILHNNFAMYFYQKNQPRKAAIHYEKILPEINELCNLTAVKILFNMGKIYNSLYNHDLAVKNFSESRLILSKLGVKNMALYKDKIDTEIDKIESHRIDEVSEESSYAAMLSKISRSMLSNRQLTNK